MIEEPTHGWLVTAPSSSPEMLFTFREATNRLCMYGTDNDAEHSQLLTMYSTAEILDI